MSTYIGSLALYDNGAIRFSAAFGHSPTVAQMEFIYRAMIGAHASTAEGTGTESVVHLAASLLAKAGAEKARQRREADVKQAVEAVR
jgi:hypothetical protein